jgi:hypothetical protein
MRLKSEQFFGEINRFLQEIEGKDEEYILKNFIAQTEESGIVWMNDAFRTRISYYTHFIRRSAVTPI